MPGNLAVSMRLAMVLILTALCVAPNDFTYADEAGDDYSVAIGLFKKEKWLLAEEAFQKFIGKHSKHSRVPLARYYLGLTQFENEKYADARKTLRSFVADFPQSADVSHARFRAAESSYFLDEFEVAIVELTEFEKLIPADAADPDLEEALAFLGDAQRRMKRPQNAVVTFEKLLKLNKEGRFVDEAKFGLAHSLEATGQSDRAMQLFREVAASSSSQRADAAQLALANLLFSKEQYEAAGDAYLRLEKDFPKSRFVPTAQLNAGYSLYRRSQFANAMAAFDRAEDTPALAVTAGYWKGLSAKGLGDFAGAAAILESVAKIAGKEPLGEQVTFQLADSALRAGRLADAEKWFTEVASRWPQGQSAAQSLYFATDCALEQITKLQGEDRDTKLKHTELLLDKFSREFGQSAFAMSQRMQRGQFFVLRGADADLQSAEVIFTAIATESQKPQTQAEARFRLGRLRQSRGNRNGAIESLRPLVDEFAKNPEIGFSEGLLLYANLSLDLGQLDEAVRGASTYLTHQQKGGLRDQALHVLLIARAQKKDWDGTLEAYDRLIKEHAESPLSAKSTLSLAELAYSQNNWDRALQFFLLLSKVDVASPLHATAVSGLGWSSFQKRDYVAAEKYFRQFVVDHPKHELTAEARFMIGDSLQKADKLPESAKAFDEAFRADRSSRHSFLSGLQAARIAVKLKMIADADQAYAALDDAFPMSKERDQLLNEWALVLYDAQQFEKSDAIFRKLIATFPESSLADNAQFSLAESDLIGGRLDAGAQAFRALADNPKADKAIQEDSLYRLIGIYAEQKKWKDLIVAQQDLQKRFGQSRYLAESLLQVGNAKLSLDDFAGAELSFLEVTRLAENPDVKTADWFPHVWALLAESQLRQKKYPEVLKTAERAKQVQGDFPLKYRVDEVVGRAYKQQPIPKFDEARQAFERVLSSPNAARTETACKAQLMIAETYFQQKNFKQAVEGYQKVYILYQFAEWQAAALFQTGICEEELRMNSQAIRSYKDLLKEFPQSEYSDKARKRLEALGSK